MAFTTKNKNACTSSVGKFKEREHLENVGVNGIILNESSRNRTGNRGLDSYVSG